MKLHAHLAAYAAMLLAAHAGPVTLDQCLRAAREQSPDLRAAAGRVQAAAAGLQEARSAWYPQLKTSAIYSRTDNPPQAFMMTLNQRTLTMDGDFNQPDDTENLRLSAGLAYRLLDLGVRSAGVAQARLAAEAQRHAEQAVRNAQAFAVTRAFYGVLQARSLVQVGEETVQSLTESLRVAGERFNAGSAVKTDVLNLEVKLAEAGEDLIRARNAQRLALAYLNTAVGTAVTTNAADLEAPADVPAPDTQGGGIENRGEWQATRLAAEIRAQAVRQARGERAPVVNAFGSMDWDSEVSTDFEDSYFVGVAAEWEVFDGFRKRGHEARAKAEWLAAQAEVEKVRNELDLDLQQAQIQAGEASERLQVARKSIGSAEEALRITRERYEQGAADITELLTAQVGLTAGKTRLSSATFALFTADANLKRAQGLLAAALQADESTNGNQEKDMIP